MAGPVRLSTDWMFRLPTLVRPGLLDAMSFEDTEVALARLLGGFLPATGARHVVTGPGGALGARAGDDPPVRFGHPRPSRTGREAAPSDPGAAASDPQWTERGAARGYGLPATRLARGASALADVLRAAADAPGPEDRVRASTPSTEDVRERRVPLGEQEYRSAADAGHHELDGSVSDAFGPVHHEPDGHRPASATSVRLVPPAAEDDDPWPADAADEVDALADVVLDRLLDQVELEFHRTYGLGEW